MRCRFLLLDVFTEHVFGGNQLAVIPDATGMNASLMQQIAQEFNFSETVFVFPPQEIGHACQLRIFTPGTELPFAGHPTVGAAYALAYLERIRLTGEENRVVFEEGVGPLEIRIHAVGGKPYQAEFSVAKLPEWGPQPPSVERIARLLGLEEADLLAGENFPEAISCGVPFLFVPLDSLEAVQRARLDPEIWGKDFSSFWAPHIYVFSYQTLTEKAQIHARMFAPAMGIKEDPATGAGAAALGGYLGKRSAAAGGKEAWVIEQGFEIGRPSVLHLEVEKLNGRIQAVWVGGSCVITGEGILDL
jgi:trans-2,3-dihydro-3-hydroxyanthranilate isomerase